MVVRNVFSDWNAWVSASASVDSALPGSHDDASLFSSSVIFGPKPKPSTIVTTIQNARTAHLILRPHTAPANRLVIIGSLACEGPVSDACRGPRGACRQAQRT